VSEPSGSEPTEGRSARVPKFTDFFFIGTACALSIVGAGAIGYGLDSWLRTTPWLTFVGLAFGIACAVLLTIAQVRKFT
jgi:Putative F0F1-ATPase subunit Ca2+/Mg2+ transporter